MPRRDVEGWRFSDLAVTGARRGTLEVMKKSFADMVRSLGLMAVIVAVMLFIGARYLIHPTAADRMPAVDYSGTVQGFGEVAHTPALAPAALPSTWRANASRLVEPTPGAHQLHVGWALPGERYAGLDEATGDADALVLSVLGHRALTVAGSTDIGGVQWQRRTSDRGEEALTRRAGSVTVVITGNASDADLRRLAASLR
jgi:hypothetical protein